MNKIFADVFFWIALASPSDQWYLAAKRFNQKNPEAPLVTTDEVLTHDKHFEQEGFRILL